MMTSINCENCIHYCISVFAYPCCKCTINHNHEVGTNNIGIYYRESVDSINNDAYEAEWIDDHESIKCSNCKWGVTDSYFWDDTISSYTYYSKYCPNCGKKMKPVTLL